MGNPYLDKVASITMSPMKLGRMGGVIRSAKDYMGGRKEFGVKDFGAKTPLIKRLKQAH